ncbi:neurexin-3-like isoform X2 [Anneissia japonica]|uniref:neurexin-3-like isoform X2 n=1 Tax=Anneissia japonica TaxID=1529436 RepID=UPI0014257DC0|nr:neurexin-3-like isoform X2 [Anneissia japonica]
MFHLLHFISILFSLPSSVPSCPYEALCEPKKTAAGTFSGDSYFYYDLSKGEEIASDNDDITFDFRTQHPNGLILGATDDDYIYVALSDGHLHVKFNLGSGAFDEKMGLQSLSDNNWHRVYIQRKRQNVVVKINDTLIEEGTTKGDFSTLSIANKFYVGGCPMSLFDNTDNFRGNIRGLFYKASNMDLPLLDLAEAGDPKVTIVGDLVIGIEDVEDLDPITFRTPESVLVVPKWEARVNGASLSFSFRTIEPNGLLMYSMGSETNGDFFGVELFEGRLFVIINLGGGITRFMPYSKLFNDGYWHNVVITRMGVATKVQVELEEAKTITDKENSKILNLEDDLFLGGVDNRENARPLPMEVFSITRQPGYVGCMRNLVLNGLSYNIAGEVQQQNVKGIMIMCKSMSPMCKEGLCRNGGQCSEGWNRFICDCSMTDYIGKECDYNATVLSFNGNQSLLVDFGNDLQTKAEDITIRFKTYRPSCALLTIYTYNAVDVLKLELVGSKVVFSINLGSGDDTSPIGEDLADGNWHTIKLRRKQRELIVILDGGEERIQNLTSTDSAMNLTSGDLEKASTKILDFRFIELGMNTRQYSVDPSQLSKRVPFVGLIEQFVFNSRDFIEMASEDPVDSIVIKNTASFGSSIDKRSIQKPITFKTKGSYISQPSPSTYPSLGIFFHFRTMEPNGLMLFNQGEGKDFIAVELVNGYLHYLYDFGDQPVTLKANTPGPLNDNQWHEVDISSNILTRFKVDNSINSKTLTSPSARRLDLIGDIYFGGVPISKYNSLPEVIKSRDGYHGCFASLEVDGHFRDMMLYGSNIPDTVVKGCNARVVECTDYMCLNGGECKESWENVYCDCSTTSYQGDRCEEAGTTYMFGSYGGLISLEYTSADWETTEENDITFGFATYSENAVLMRIESATQADFIEINMDNGIIVAVYQLSNVAEAESRLATSSKKFNDGEFHVVRFYRKGSNATLIMDQIVRDTRTDRASEASVFDDQAKIYIGGRIPKEGRRKRRQVESVFVGVLSGAKVNKIKPLQLAASGHPRTGIQGNVTLIPNATSFLENSLTLPTPVLPGPGPDVRTTNNPVQSSPAESSDIFTATIECNDDEECETSSGSGMDGLFSPASGNPRPSGKPIEDSSATVSDRIVTTPVFICADGDDEDCLDNEGSGSSKNPFISKTPDDNIIIPTIVGGKGSMPMSPGTNPSRLPSVAPTIGAPPLQSTSFIEQTGMIIGIAAGGVVIMLLVILLLYKYRNRSEGSYKINESRNFDLQTVRSALLPARNGTIPAKAPKSQLPPGYASKEWYV